LEEGLPSAIGVSAGGSRSVIPTAGRGESRRGGGKLADSGRGMLPASQSQSIQETVELKRQGNEVSTSGVLGDKEVSCLIDTGAITAVKEQVVIDSGLPYEREIRAYGLADTAATTQSIGVVSTGLMIGGTTYKTRLRIFPNLSHDVYLGFDFLMKNGFNLQRVGEDRGS